MHEDDEWVLKNDKKKEKYKCIFSGNGNMAMALGIP